MKRIVYEEMKKIFMRPIIRITFVFFVLISIYLTCFVSGGRSYFYDADRDALVEISSPSEIIGLKKEYASNLKGTITNELVESFYKEYQDIINDINSYGENRDLQAEKDRRYELLGEGFSEDEIDKIDEGEPIYDLNPYIKYNELWKFQPIKHLFILYESDNKYEYVLTKKLLANGTLFDWCGGYVNAISRANNTLTILIGILIVLGTSTIFSEELQYNLRGIIFTTKFGKGNLIFGKIVSSIIYTAIVVSVSFGVDLLISEIVFGLGNGNVYIQMSEEFMGYNLLFTHSKLLWMEWICIFIGAIYLNMIVLFVSSICNNDFVAIFISTILYLMLNIGTLLLNVEEHIWKLFLPTTLMHPLQYFEYNQSVLPAIFMSVIIIVILLVITIKIYTKVPNRKFSFIWKSK
ncbi:hypothetical protein AALB52_24015 [Lachnospiraceae bacterium 38-14]